MRKCYIRCGRLILQESGKRGLEQSSCSHVGLSGVRHFAVLRRVPEHHSAAAEVAGRLSPVYIADWSATVWLLSPRGDLPFQLFPLGLHLLCGELHPSG